MSYEDEPKQQQYPPYMTPMDSYGTAIIHMTDTDREIRELELTFKNQRVDENNEIIALGQPLMNDEGIRSVIGQIQSVVNRITIMSNLKEYEISSLMEYVTDSLVKDLMMNREKYALRFENRTKIVSSSLTLIYNCLKRSQEGDDKKFWKGSTQTIEHTSINKQRQPNTWLGKFTGWN